MGDFNQTPGANRLHIGIFGRTNSGKSSLINALTNQRVSIVADLAGTTTDPVYKAMELHPLGACTIIDTAGFDDETKLGEKRLERTKLAAERTDIAVIVLSAEEGGEIGAELSWYEFFRKRNTPVVFVVNKTDRDAGRAEILRGLIERETGEEALLVCAATGENIPQIRVALARKMPEDYGQQSITGGLAEDGDLVLLVMPQDIQAPKGRLILPQVQTIRELLDQKCLVVCCTTDKFCDALKHLQKPPKLIVTDSQVFGYVYEHKPEESLLTSFSVLFAACKGDLAYYAQGAKRIDALREDSRVLVAECCTHAPLEEDIGRVKLPRILRKRAGAGLTVDVVSGSDFPDDLTNYDLIIQCGACMFNRAYVMSRIERARAQSVPMTNYGVAIAHLAGILDQIAMPRSF